MAVIHVNATLLSIPYTILDLSVFIENGFCLCLEYVGDHIVLTHGSKQLFYGYIFRKVIIMDGNRAMIAFCFQVLAHLDACV